MKTENNIRAYEMATIILSYLGDRISPEEQEKLDAWLEECGGNRLLFRQIVDDETQSREIRKLLEHNLPLAWTGIQRKVIIKRRNRKIGWIGSAAAVILVFIGVMLFFQLQQKVDRIPMAENTVIVPGRAFARLTVANGSSYVLDANVADSLPRTAVLDGNEIIFRRDTAEVVTSTIVKYSKLEIPEGGEYKITLPDGTRVFLNSSTVLRFPDDFSICSERVVYLTGEAYFEVAKNKEKPFIVKCSDYEVKVLGTSFNISDYADNEYSHTTLKEGKVEIIQGEEETVLYPGQQAKWQHGHLEVQEVNIENYTTWMNENFRFESENIDEILKRIARWYVVDIFYVNSSVKNYHFTGYLPRYANIEDVLELMSLTTDIRFEVKDKTVLVGKK